MLRPIERAALFLLTIVGLTAAGPAWAQVPPLPPLPRLDPIAPEAEQGYEKIPLTEAVRRALVRNPAATIAMQEIKRAEALLVESRAASLPSLTANATLLRLDSDRAIPGRVVAPKDQQSANIVLSVPVIAPQRWMQWSQASANRDIAQASSEDVRRSLAVAVARAYLSVVAQRRQVDIITRAVEADRAHAEFTHARFSGGVGTRVDEVRAAQQLASDQAQLAAAYTGLAKAREALGVLLGSDNPVDVRDDISLPAGDTTFTDAAVRRQDVQLAKKRALQAEKVKRDSWSDYMPLLTGQFQPFLQHPSTLTTPETGWQATLVLTIPIFEGGLRSGQLREREALLAEARAQYDGLLRQTRADLRVSAEETRRADEAMRSAQAAAELAHQALDLANLAYKTGATTNIEVIDAERRARDADSAVVIAEDNVRQARLNLLVAAGQFP
jgi:outer membrane protein